MTLIFSFSQICYAQETAPSVEAEAQVATKESTKNSQEERLDKNFSILVGYGYELVIDAIHLNLGYFINPNLILELKVAHEKEENNNSYSKIKEVTVVSIGPKFFVANSFYVKPSFE